MPYHVFRDGRRGQMRVHAHAEGRFPTLAEARAHAVNACPRDWSVFFNLEAFDDACLMGDGYEEGSPVRYTIPKR